MTPSPRRLRIDVFAAVLVASALPSLPRAARADEPRVTSVDIEGGEHLASFHRALEALAQGRRTEPVRIVWYGDSNHAADRFSGAMRRLLQARYGDAGHGFVAFGNPWPGYRHEDVTRGASYGLTVLNPTTRRGHDTLWGYGGIATVGGPGATMRVGTTPDGAVGRSVARFTVLYLEHPRGHEIQVSLDGRRTDAFSTEGHGAGAYTIDVPDGAHELGLRFDGTERVFGAVLERERPGVVLDAMGIGALSTYHLLRADRDLFVQQLGLRRPDLVVLTMGTNEQNPRRLPDERRRLLERVRAAAPGASILTLAPPDHARFRGGRWKSEPRMRAVTDTLRTVSAETGSAYWDLYTAMGGAGSMNAWASRGEAAGDRIHFQQPLADRLAVALDAALQRDHERFLRGDRVEPPGTLAMR